MSLQEQSEKRKEHLQKLREMAQKRPGNVTFKSYVPETEELKKLVVEAPKLGPLAEDTVEKRAQEIIKKAHEQDQTGEELDLTNLKPKKANWDLKRDLESKLNQLDKMTNIAMADMIRKRNDNLGERLKEQGDIVGIAMATDQDRFMADTE